MKTIALIASLALVLTFTGIQGQTFPTSPLSRPFRDLDWTRQDTVFGQILHRADSLYKTLDRMYMADLISQEICDQEQKKILDLLYLDPNGELPAFFPESRDLFEMAHEKWTALRSQQETVQLIQSIENAQGLTPGAADDIKRYLFGGNQWTSEKIMKHLPVPVVEATLGAPLTLLESTEHYLKSIQPLLPEIGEVKDVVIKLDTTRDKYYFWHQYHISATINKVRVGVTGQLFAGIRSVTPLDVNWFHGRKMPAVHLLNAWLSQKGHPLRVQRIRVSKNGGHYTGFGMITRDLFALVTPEVARRLHLLNQLQHVRVSFPGFLPSHDYQARKDALRLMERYGLLQDLDGTNTQSFREEVMVYRNIHSGGDYCDVLEEFTRNRCPEFQIAMNFRPQALKRRLESLTGGHLSTESVTAFPMYGGDSLLLTIQTANGKYAKTFLSEDFVCQPELAVFLGRIVKQENPRLHPLLLSGKYLICATSREKRRLEEQFSVYVEEIL